MGGDETVFGVNFADGRIKRYPMAHPQMGEMKQFVRYARGNPDCGKNNFLEGPTGMGAAAYICFGQAFGYMTDPFGEV